MRGKPVNDILYKIISYDVNETAGKARDPSRAPNLFLNHVK